MRPPPASHGSLCPSCAQRWSLWLDGPKATRIRTTIYGRYSKLQRDFEKVHLDMETALVAAVELLSNVTKEQRFPDKFDLDYRSRVLTHSKCVALYLGSRIQEVDDGTISYRIQKEAKYTSVDDDTDENAKKKRDENQADLLKLMQDMTLSIDSMKCRSQLQVDTSDVKRFTAVDNITVATVAVSELTANMSATKQLMKALMKATPDMQVHLRRKAKTRQKSADIMKKFEEDAKRLRHQAEVSLYKEIQDRARQASWLIT